ncbi:hypothetical protein SLEP1_g24425 [Rubroshorea leprosula]|uniref:Uncharacterized protein n=1 Tax=Rubroshorea leprosula TaxID=152421 RepID=A0AAV5JFN5_9ROSI|nr:hypothetical protein SLEP1_g24425 [Rubroshorea leprosula]
MRTKRRPDVAQSVEESREESWEEKSRETRCARDKTRCDEF